VRILWLWPPVLPTSCWGGRPALSGPALDPRAGGRLTRGRRQGRWWSRRGTWATACSSSSRVCCRRRRCRRRRRRCRRRRRSSSNSSRSSSSSSRSRRAGGGGSGSYSCSSFRAARHPLTPPLPSCGPRLRFRAAPCTLFFAESHSHAPFRPRLRSPSSHNLPPTCLRSTSLVSAPPHSSQLPFLAYPLPLMCAPNICAPGLLRCVDINAVYIYIYNMRQACSGVW
jgi:hypothetical protein